MTQHGDAICLFAYWKLHGYGGEMVKYESCLWGSAWRTPEIPAWWHGRDLNITLWQSSTTLLLHISHKLFFQVCKVIISLIRVCFIRRNAQPPRSSVVREADSWCRSQTIQTTSHFHLQSPWSPWANHLNYLGFLFLLLWSRRNVAYAEWSAGEADKAVRISGLVRRKAPQEK